MQSRGLNWLHYANNNGPLRDRTASTQKLEPDSTAALIWRYFTCRGAHGGAADGKTRHNMLFVNGRELANKLMKV